MANESTRPVSCLWVARDELSGRAYHAISRDDLLAVEELNAIVTKRRR
jgi:hypothetical protein